MANVEIYRSSELSTEQILEFGAAHVAIATGSEWRRNGAGSSHPNGFASPTPADKTFTPDDIMAGKLPHGSCLVFDDDGFYMASVIAEKLVESGQQVIYVTSRNMVSYWSIHNQEQARVHRHLHNLGVQILLNQSLDGFDGERAVLSDVYTDIVQKIAVDNIVLVTMRKPRDQLYHQLLDAIEKGAAGAPKTARCIGDADAPAIIAAAVYAGHKYARELDCAIDRDSAGRVDRGTVLTNEGKH